MTNGNPMRSRVPVMLSVALVSGVLAAVPAAAAPPIVAGVAVTASPLVVDEGEIVTFDAVYDERGGAPVGDFRFRFDGANDVKVTPVDLDPSFSATVDRSFGSDGSHVAAVVVRTAAGSYKGSRRVTVMDVAPVMAPFDDALAPERSPFLLTISFSDPGTLDVHRISVDWGDGAIETFDPAVGERNPVVSHTYGSRGGPIPVVVTVEDVANGASSTHSFDVTVVRECNGKAVTIDMRRLGIHTVTGTRGADVILGTFGDDVITGRGGDDTICALSGNDRVTGGPGADEIFGGSGDDTLFGSGGNDEMSGGPGEDRLDGDRGNDHLDGGSHDDWVFGDVGNDIVKGGTGADTVNGGRQHDDLDGGGGNDLLFGSSGDDILRGSSGSDVLKGGDGEDVLLGGSGSDRLIGSNAGTDLLFASESPDRDTMDGGSGEDAVGVGKRGTLSSGIRTYVTEDEALAFQGSYLLSDFTTYHSCCENRVINIQLMADAVGGHVVMPGDTFSINAVVGRRTSAKGYKPAGAIIGGYVQCCDFAENIGGGTSQFATTFYNAIFFSAMEDVFHQPHTAWFSRYPQGREATMGYPSPDVKFRNTTDHPVLITTHHAGYRGRSIEVKFWGDNGHLDVTAGSRITARYNKITRWNVNRDLNHCSYPGPQGSKSGSKQVSIGTDGFTVEVYQRIDYPNGRKKTNTTRWRYAGNYEVWEYNPYAPSSGCGGGGGGGGGGGTPPPIQVPT